MSKKSQNLKITVGDINHSVGVAIGQDIKASVQQAQVGTDQIVAMLRDLVGLIDTNADVLDGAAAAREAAVLACEEAESRTPRWARVRDLLIRISPAVTGIASLTEAVDNIRALIPR
jgi:hypothetical protein